MGKEVSTGIGHNIIAQGTKIVGSITTNSDIRIDGELEGDLICKGKIVVGQQGNIKGNVDCTNAEVMGNINGKIIVSGTLSLKATSKIWGQIKTKILSIEPEAQFTGSCEMGNENNAHPTK